MRGAAPAIVLVPGVGMFSFGSPDRRVKIGVGTAHAPAVVNVALEVTYAFLAGWLY